MGGALAIETAANFNIDIMFFSSYGVTDRGKIADTSEEETELRAALLKNVATSVFLCDSSKFGKSALYNIGSIADVDILIADEAPPDHYPKPRRETILVQSR